MAEYDTLKIRIEADSTEANASVKSLSANLRKLDKTAQDLDTDRVKEVKRLLQDIAKIDFSNVAKGLDGVVKAFNALSTKSAKSVKDTTSKASGLQVPPKGTAVGDVFVPNASQYEVPAVSSDTLTSYAELKQSMIGIYDVSKMYNNEVQYTTKNQGKANKATQDLSKQTDALGKTISNASKETKKLGENAKNTSTNGLKKLINQFNKIMKYRIIRKIIQEIYKALTEGVKNVIEFDQATSDAVDKIAGKFEFLKNSIGAMLAPLIQVVEPILTELLQVSGELGNSFAEIFAGANGQTKFAKARDDLKGFNDEAKKTQALGIDELNVIQQGNDYFTEEQVNLGEKENALAKELGELFAQLKEVFSKVFDIAKQFISKILPAISKMLVPIVNIISKIFDLIEMLLDDTFEGVNDSLVDFTDMLGEIFHFVDELINQLMPVLVPIVKIIGTIINVINNSISSISGGIGGIVSFVSRLLIIIKPITVILGFALTVVETIFQVIEALIRTVNDLANFNWGNIGNNWANMASNIAKAWEAYGKSFNYDSYASGGFPEDGFFFANHNELVGTFTDGRTAVANNDQITQGIYEAVRDAMRDANGGQEVVINLDGQEIARVVTKKQKNFGADVVINGNLAWGK